MLRNETHIMLGDDDVKAISCNLDGKITAGWLKGGAFVWVECDKVFSVTTLSGKDSVEVQTFAEVMKLLDN